MSEIKITVRISITNAINVHNNTANASTLKPNVMMNTMVLKLRSTKNV